MKRILPFLSIAVVLAACGNNAKTSTESVASVVEETQALKVDTTGLAEFQNWKLQQQIAEIETPAQPTVQYATATPAKKARKTYRPAPKAVDQVPAVSTSTTETSTGSGDDVAMNSESTNAAEAPEKKGWSKAAKGAVIGGASGAAAGAVINKKNRALGAVIGGVIGAGGGYVIGRGMDKKDDRY